MTQRGSAKAQLYVRPLPAHRPDEPDGLYEMRARGLLANKELATEMSLRFGGMFGDWRNIGAVPDLDPLDLADLPVGEWNDWLTMTRALKASGKVQT